MSGVHKPPHTPDVCLYRGVLVHGWGAGGRPVRFRSVGRKESCPRSTPGAVPGVREGTILPAPPGSGGLVRVCAGGRVAWCALGVLPGWGSWVGCRGSGRPVGNDASGAGGPAFFRAARPGGVRFFMAGSRADGRASAGALPAPESAAKAGAVRRLRRHAIGWAGPGAASVLAGAGDFSAAKPGRSTSAATSSGARPGGVRLRHQAVTARRGRTKTAKPPTHLGRGSASPGGVRRCEPRLARPPRRRCQPAPSTGVGSHPTWPAHPRRRSRRTLPATRLGFVLCR